MKILLGICLAVSLVVAQPKGDQGTGEVVAGDPQVDGTLIHAAVFLKRMTIVRNGEEKPVGMLKQELTELPNGMLCTQTFDFQGQTSVDSAFFQHSTLIPRWHRSHNPKRIMKLDFQGRTVKGSYHPTGQPVEAINQLMEEPVFDSNILDLVIAALPLKQGYTAKVPFYVYEEGGLVWHNVTVEGEDVLRLSSGHTATCWKVLTANPKREITFWIEKKTREVFRSVVTLPNGEFRMERDELVH